MVRGNHVHAIRLDWHPVLDLMYRHRGDALEQLRQKSLVGWIKVLDDDKGQSAFFRDILQKLLQGLESSCGSSNTDNGESGARGFFRWRRGFKVRGLRVVTFGF